MKTVINLLNFLLLLLVSVNIHGVNLDKTIWRCTSKECLKWTPEGTVYVELCFHGGPYPTVNYVYYKQNPFLSKFEVWYVTYGINDRIAVGKGGQSPYVPVEIRGNTLILKNSKIWKEKPDFIFYRIK